MSVQLELWQLITLLLAFFASVGAAGRILLAQIEKRLEAQFGAMERARREASDVWTAQFAALREESRREADQWSRIERDFLTWKADLPTIYVRRDDYVRGQSVIEAKQDALAVRQDAMSSMIGQMSGRLESVLKGEKP